MYFNETLQWQPNFLFGAFLEFNVFGCGKYFVDDANKIEVSDYMVINAKIGIAEPIYLFNNISIKGFLALNNITDKKYSSSAFINPDLDKTSKLPKYLEPGLPRNFVLGININWN